jgi:hypothetical protein
MTAYQRSPLHATYPFITFSFLGSGLRNPVEGRERSLLAVAMVTRDCGHPGDARPSGFLWNTRKQAYCGRSLGMAETQKEPGILNGPVLGSRVGHQKRGSARYSLRLGAQAAPQDAIPLSPEPRRPCSTITA